MEMLRYCISLSVLVFIKVSSAAVDQRTRCPTSIPTNKYLFAYNNVCIELFPNQQSWFDSRKHCQQHGGDLVVIQNMAKQTFIINALKQAHWHRHGIWIGGTDRDKEGEWKWVTGELIAWSFWQKGQGPDQHGFLFAGGRWEDCAMIRLQESYKWHDYPCSGLLSHFSCICEYNLTQAIAPTTKRTPTATSSIPKSTTTLAVPTTTSITTTSRNVPTKTTHMSTTSKPSTRMSTTTTTHMPTTTTHAPTTTTHAPTTIIHAPTTTSKSTTTILPTSSTNTPITTSKSTTTILPTSSTHTPTTTSKSTTKILPTSSTHAPSTTSQSTTRIVSTSTTHVATTTSKPTTTRLVPKITYMSTNKMRTPTTALQTGTSKAMTTVQKASSTSTTPNVVTSPTTVRPKIASPRSTLNKTSQAITTMKAETSVSTSQITTNGQFAMSSKSKSSKIKPTFVSGSPKHVPQSSRGPTVNSLGQKGNPTKGKSYTGYIIGGSVAVVVLAGILMAVLIYKRRRDSKLRTVYSHGNPTYDMMHGKGESSDIKMKYGESLS